VATIKANGGQKNGGQKNGGQKNGGQKNGGQKNGGQKDGGQKNGISLFSCPPFFCPPFFCPLTCLHYELKNFRGGSSSRPVFTLTYSRAAQTAGCHGIEQESKIKGELV
jgi:hypothetical protein